MQRSLVLLAMTLSLAACAGLRAAPDSPIADPAATLAGLNESFAPAKIKGCFSKSLGEQDPCRNEIVQALLVAIDLRYAEFEVGFFNSNRLGGFTATLATLGLSAAGAVSGAGTTRVLSAAVTGITGAREAFDREVLADQTAAALLTTMRAQRNTVALRIREGLAQPATRYPLGIALSDLYAYFRAGTIPGALSGITQAAGVRAEQAQEDLRNAVPVQRGAPARFLQRLIGAPDAAVAARNEQSIRRAMDDAGLPASVTVFDFVWRVDPTREAQVADVARQLGYQP